MGTGRLGKKALGKKNAPGRSIFGRRKKFAGEKDNRFLREPASPGRGNCFEENAIIPVRILHNLGKTTKT